MLVAWPHHMQFIRQSFPCSLVFYIVSMHCAFLVSRVYNNTQHKVRGQQEKIKAVSKMERLGGEQTSKAAGAVFFNCLNKRCTVISSVYFFLRGV